MARLLTGLVALLAVSLAAGCGGGAAAPLETAASPTSAPTLTAPVSTTEASTAATSNAAATTQPDTSAPAGATTGSAACGPVQTFPSAGRKPVRKEPPASAYTSFPPTSGPHDTALAPWGASERELPLHTLAANVEAGGIEVLYGDQVSPGWIGSAVGWAAQDPGGVLVAPLPRLHGTIVLAAWRHLVRCTQFDDAAFTAFRDAYRFKGPVQLPPEAYRP